MKETLDQGRRLHEEKRSSPRIRLPLVFLGSFIIILSGLAVIWNAMLKADLMLRKKLLQQAFMLSEAISPDRVDKLNGDETDLGNPEYISIKEQLAVFKQTRADYRFVYLMGRNTKGDFFFYADNEPEDSKDYSPPGQVYENGESAGLNLAYETGTTQAEGPYTDPWGTFVSALAPVKDPFSQKTLAVVGIDMNITDWKKSLFSHVIPHATFTLLMVVIFTTGSFLWNRRISCSGKKAGGWIRHLESLVVFFAGTAVAFFTAWIAHRNEHQVRYEAFERLAYLRTAIVSRTLCDLRDSLIEGISHFVLGNENVTDDEFQTYGSYLIKNQAVKRWMWVPAVSPDQKRHFEETVRSQEMRRAMKDSELYPGCPPILPVCVGAGGLFPFFPIIRRTNC